MAVSCPGQVSESVGLLVNQFVKASLELRLVHIVSIPIAVYKYDVVLLNVIVNFLLCNGRVVAH